MSKFGDRIHLPGKGSRFGADEEDFTGLTVPQDKDLWLIGDLGITLTGGKVSQWDDQSGNGHHVTQGSGSLQPTVATPSDGNSHQAVRWAGGQLLLSANVDWGSLTQATVFIVAKKATATQATIVVKGNPAITAGVELLFDAVGQDISILATQSNATYSYYSTGANTYPSAGTTPHILSAVWDMSLSVSNEQKLWVQGFAQTMVPETANDLSNLGSNSPYSIGGRPALGTFIGDLYEVIVYKRALSTSERRAVELYLANRYNVLTDQRPMTSALQYSDCTVWFNPSIGLTTVDAAVLDPTDLSTANWLPLNVSARTTHTLTEDSTAGAVHGVIEVPGTTGLLINHRYHVHAEVPASSGNGRYVIIASGSGTEAVYLDTQLGTVQFTDGVLSNVVYSGGVLDYDTTSAGGPNVYVLIGDGTHSLTHSGNGLRTATVNNITVTQRNVSAWANQGTGGSAWDVTQVTASLKPTLVSNGGEHGGPALFYGAAGQTLASASATLSQPFTAIVRMASTAIDGVQREFLDSSTTAFGRLMGKDSSNELFIYAGISIFRSPPFTNGVFYRCDGVFNGATSLARRDDSESTGNVGANAASGITVGSRSGGGANGWIGYIEDVIMYNRAMSRAEISVVNVFLSS